MSHRICSVDDCGRATLARGYCGRHYQRHRRHGDPLAGNRLIGVPDEVRFWPKVDRDGPVLDEELGACWVWTRSRTRQGYGSFSSGGRSILAHRFAYALEHGTAPEFVDHACRNTACVRPSHLREATRSENNAHLAGARPTSRTGVRGVRVARSGRFEARVRQESVGTFDTLVEAAEAVRARRSEVFGKFAGC